MPYGFFGSGEEEEDDLIERLPHSASHEPNPRGKPHAALVFDYDQIDSIIESSDPIENTLYLSGKLASGAGVAIGMYGISALGIELLKRPYTTPVQELGVLGLSLAALGIARTITTYKTRIIERTRRHAALEELHTTKGNGLKLPHW